jgi:hypothetical protein
MARKLIVLLSGALAVGKTTVRDAFISRHNFDYVKSGRYLMARAKKSGIPVSRTSLQDLGDKCDIETDYRWLIDDVAVPAMHGNAVCERWVVDAVRKERQIAHFREKFQADAAVIHLHLTAPDNVLEGRYEARESDGVPYAIAIAHDNERSSRALGDVADFICDSSVNSAAEIADKVMEIE